MVHSNCAAKTLIQSFVTAHCVLSWLPLLPSQASATLPPELKPESTQNKIHPEVQKKLEQLASEKGAKVPVIVTLRALNLSTEGVKRVRGVKGVRSVSC